VGYIYTDWIPQISYSSPKYGGFQYSAGVFQGMDLFNFSGLATSATATGHDQPGLQAKGSYEWTGTVGGKAWASALSQKVKAAARRLIARRQARAFPVKRSISGAKVNVADFEGVLYGYSGDGVGTTAIGFDAAAVVGTNAGKSANRKAGMCKGPTRSGSSSRV